MESTRTILNKLARLERSLEQGHPLLCPYCPYLTPGSAGGECTSGIIILPADDPQMQHVICERCFRCAVGRTERNESGQLIIHDPVAAEIPV